MFGSLTDADDAVQEAWLRLARTDTSDVGNLGGRLTTVVGRVCPDMLRTRKSRGEEPLEAERLPDPVVTSETTPDPEHEALIADMSIGRLLSVFRNRPSVTTRFSLSSGLRAGGRTARLVAGTLPSFVPGAVPPGRSL